jgi:hypothetical protein
MRSRLPIPAISLSLIFLLTAISVFLIGSGKAWGGEERQGQSRMGLTAGVPHLLGVETGHFLFNEIQIGAAFGFLPVNSFLQEKVRVKNVNLNDEIFLSPSAEYQMLAPSVFLRIYPFDSAFFSQVGYSIWFLRADAVGDLQSQSLGMLVPEAVSGSAEVDLPVASVMVGYEFIRSAGIFAFASVGFQYLLNPRTRVNLDGGLVASDESLKGLEEEFNKASDDAELRLNERMNKLRDENRVLPAAIVSVGFEF